jgi:hypothetical protein
MTQITISIGKETPHNIATETALFIMRLSEMVHGVPVPAPQHTAEILTFPRPAATSVEPTEHEHDLDEVDADGYPWDARIHASGKGKNLATGHWRQRRGVPPHLVRQVEAELRNKMAAKKVAASPAPLAAPLPPTPLSPPAPVLPALQVPPPPPLAEPVVEAAPVAAVEAPPAPLMTVQEAPLTPAATPDVVAKPTQRSYDELLVLVTDVLMADKLTEDDIYSVLKQHQAKELSDLVEASPEAIAAVYNMIEGAIE